MEVYTEDDIYLHDLSPPPSPTVERSCFQCPIMTDADVYVGKESDMKKEDFEFGFVCCGCIKVEYEEKTKRSRITIHDIADPSQANVLDTFMTHPAWISQAGQVGMWLVPHNSARLGYLFLFDSEFLARDFVADVNRLVRQDTAIKSNLLQEEQAVRNLFRTKRPIQGGTVSPLVRTAQKVLAMFWLRT